MRDLAPASLRGGRGALIPNSVERFRKRHPDAHRALSGIVKRADIRNDPVSAQQHFMPQRARDDAGP
jgi:hypothetical protein